jgi:hypothetical protein
MILISVISGLMEVKHQCETDKEAEKYLKGVEKRHRDYREYLGRRYATSLPYTGREKAKKIEDYIKTCLPLKVEIINTNHNQYHLLNELK